MKKGIQAFIKAVNLMGTNKDSSQKSSLDVLNDFFSEVYSFTAFIIKYFKQAITPPYEVNEFLRQCYLVGNKSFPLVSTTAIIMGFVFTIQSRPTLVKFGAESWIPA